MKPETGTPKPCEINLTAPEAETNAAAVRQTLAESHRQCLSYLRRRLGNGGDARDVMQDLMRRAIDRTEALCHDDIGAGWFSRLLATSVADHLRGAATLDAAAVAAKVARAIGWDQTS